MNFDGYRTIEVIVVSKINSPEPTLAQTPHDRVTIDLFGIAFAGAIRMGTGRHRGFGSRQFLRLIHRSVLDDDRSFSRLPDGVIVSSGAKPEKWARTNGDAGGFRLSAGGV
jgi:hypothetical protein